MNKAIGDALGTLTRASSDPLSQFTQYTLPATGSTKGVIARGIATPKTCIVIARTPIAAARLLAYFEANVDTADTPDDVAPPNAFKDPCEACTAAGLLGCLCYTR